MGHRTWWSLACSFQAMDVPPHGNRFLRLTPNHTSGCDGPPPPSPCPPGYTANGEAGYWFNTDPCPGPARLNCTEDLGQTATECAKKCNEAGDCVAFELFEPRGASSCYIFHKTLKPPFVSNAKSMTCLKNKGI